jgi:hypothetical protein
MFLVQKKNPGRVYICKVRKNWNRNFFPTPTHFLVFFHKLFPFSFLTQHSFVAFSVLQGTAVYLREAGPALPRV